MTDVLNPEIAFTIASSGGMRSVANGLSSTSPHTAIAWLLLLIVPEDEQGY
jgi:hypothetical protein